MPTVNNIFNIKISNVSSNGSVNFGNTLFRSNAANQKSVGGYSVIGDGSVSSGGELNNVADPDLLDQPTSQL